jgi:DUF917 family protein
VSSADITKVARRLEAVRQTRQVFAEMGVLMLEELSSVNPDDADRIAQAGRTAAANELARVFDEARADMDAVLNAR